MTRASLLSDEWMTPPGIIDATGPYDLDPCAAARSWWRTAAHYYTKAQNGPGRRWFGRVWLNPPYSDVAPWIARLADHGRGTALVFAKTETEWFIASVWRRAAALLFIEGRLRFHRSSGEQSTKDAGRPSVLVAFGLEDAGRLEACGIAGAFVPLACAGQSIAVLRHTDAGDVTWSELIKRVARRQGGRLSVRIACVLIANHPKAAANRHLDAKVRQVCQGPAFVRIGRGQFRLREAA